MNRISAPRTLSKSPTSLYISPPEAAVVASWPIGALWAQPRHVGYHQRIDLSNRQESEKWQVKASSRKYLCPMNRPWPKRARR
jgi:hypothetical protein